MIRLTHIHGLDTSRLKRSRRIGPYALSKFRQLQVPAAVFGGLARSFDF